VALFSDPLHNDFASFPLGLAPYGGGDVGEVELLARRVTPGDDDSFFEGFSALARRRIGQGDAAAAEGHDASGRDCYLRAALLLAIAYHPLYGAPVDPRLPEAFHLQMETFDKAVALGRPAAEKVDVPYEDTRLPAYFIRALGFEEEVRPVILVGGGWDSTVVENYFSIAMAALQRGYHVLLHDGPGQGRLLIDEGLPLRHDWEKVVTPVVDAALGIDLVDPDRIVYQPWSLGGYMAPRAAANEHRLAAIIADPGQLDVGGKTLGPIQKMLGAEGAARLPELGRDDERALMRAFERDRVLYWKIVKRGFWTAGVPDLSAWLEEMTRWKLDEGLVAEIRCPTLVTAADNDLASTNARELYDALTCPSGFIRFVDADGAGMHCALLNRSIANRSILDWLDDTLGLVTARRELASVTRC
jgi:alpha-beta hydrolase superfamily lysophospholipase